MTTKTLHTTGAGSHFTWDQHGAVAHETLGAAAREYFAGEGVTVEWREGWVECYATPPATLATLPSRSYALADVLARPGLNVDAIALTLAVALAALLLLATSLPHWHDPAGPAGPARSARSAKSIGSLHDSRDSRDSPAAPPPHHQPSL